MKRPKVPKAPSLAELQAWFGEAISRPLPMEYAGNPLAVSAPELRESGNATVRGRGGLSGFERVGIYNQQYWFRLITIMQGEYPCAVHRLGLRPFNEWVIRYLEAHPPSSPFLSRLDEAWPAFIEARYQGPDRDSVVQAVAFDRAFSRAFDAPEGAALTQEGAGGLLQLAPHVSVLRLDWDFPAYRIQCLKDESLEDAIALQPGPSCLVIWRGSDLAVWQKPVSPAACKVLGELREPTTIPDAFDRLEGRLSAEEQAELETSLSQWFAIWVRASWLVQGVRNP